MNPLKKLKLKSQLRNCDYMLAGTVIKQQYYDANKSTVINRLIDDFMANPGFDNALKLVEYNDMMVFYFTESCAGGLYVRKTAQDPSRSASPSLYETIDCAKETTDRVVVSHPLDISENDTAVMSEKTVRHRQILQESEEWMEQMIAREARKQPPVTPFFKKTEPEFKYEEPSEPDEVLVETIEFIASKEQAPEWLPIIEQEPIVETVAQTAAAEPEVAVAFEAVPEPKPIKPLQPLSQQAAVRKRTYQNVIATLKIDIHTMSKQLEEYRRELSYYPSNEKQLIAWIKALEEAIEEFSEVVDLLEENE